MSNAERANTPSGAERFTLGLIFDVFEVLERHGYPRGDYAHVGEAMGLLLTLAETYEGVTAAPGEAVA